MALALAACESSSTGSDVLQGVYTLRTVEGRPLPATLDSLQWSDGVTYTVDRVVAGSIQFQGRDTAQYTLSTRVVTYNAPGDSLVGARCFSMPVVYRVQGDRLILVVEPALVGQTGRLRLDSLQIGGETLAHTTRNGSGRSVRLEYATGGQPAQCTLTP